MVVCCHKWRCRIFNDFTFLLVVKKVFLDFHTHKIKPDSIYNVIVEEEESKEPNGCYSAGIHPWYITNAEVQLKILEKLLQQNKCLLIGECGIDKYKGASLNLQKKIFTRQIEFSEQHNKPMVIHCVKAYNEIIQIHQKYQPKQRWVIHGFNKGKQLAKQLAEKGLSLSFGTDLFHSETRRKALKEIPISQLFLETDENTIHTIQELYILASEIIKIPVKELEKQIESNLWRITGWKEQNCW